MAAWTGPPGRRRPALRHRRTRKVLAHRAVRLKSKQLPLADVFGISAHDGSGVGDRATLRAPELRGNTTRTNRTMGSILWLIVLCGALSIVYGVWATRSLLAADAGTARMQEISAAVREGAQAYLKRQYTTIAIVGVVIFVIAWILLGRYSAIGFAIGA